MFENAIPNNLSNPVYIDFNIVKELNILVEFKMIFNVIVVYYLESILADLQRHYINEALNFFLVESLKATPL